MAEECAWYDLACKGKETISDSVSSGASNALENFADGVTAAAIDLVGTLGTMWVRVPTPALDSQVTQIENPERGVFNEQVDLALSYMGWIGLGVTGLGVILLGVVLAMNARRGDGAGFVNKATTIIGGAVLISAATTLGSFVIPARSLQVSGTIGFLQDQTMYLTMALAAMSLIIAGIQMAWSHRAEPAQEVLKSLLTLATVTVAGVTFLNLLVKGTDALAVQIIDAAVGEDFADDLLALLALDPGNASDPVWLGGSAVLIIVGGLIAIVVGFLQVMLMTLRTGMLFLIAGILPLAASFTNTPKGKQFFEKTIAWILAFAFYKPAAAAIYGVAIKLSTTGIWEGEEGDPGIFQFAAGVMMVLASIAALPVLVGFLSPVLSAVGSSGGGSAMGMAALGAAIPGGASRAARSGQGFGSGPLPSQQSQGKPKGSGSSTSSAGMDKAKGGASTAAAGAAGAATAGVTQAASALKKGQEAIASETQAAAGEEASGTQSTTGSGKAERLGGAGNQANAVGAQSKPNQSGAAQTKSTQGGSGTAADAGTSGPTGSGRGGHSQTSGTKRAGKASSGPSGAGRSGSSQPVHSGAGAAGKASSGPSGAGRSGTAQPIGTGPGGASPQSGQRTGSPGGANRSQGAGPADPAPGGSRTPVTKDSTKQNTQLGPEERGPRGADRI